MYASNNRKIKSNDKHLMMAICVYNHKIKSNPKWPSCKRSVYIAPQEDHCEMKSRLMEKINKCQILVKCGGLSL